MPDQKQHAISNDLIQSLIKYAQDGGDLEIVSGEGEQGTVEVYDGKLTLGAIRCRLHTEKCGGDRWAIIRTDRYNEIGY